MQYGKSQEAIDRLTAEQRRVIQEAGTERPFTGEYNDHTEPGIYVDIASGEPLFASSKPRAPDGAVKPQDSGLRQIPSDLPSGSWRSTGAPCR
jgi:hypothetical protein